MGASFLLIFHVLHAPLPPPLSSSSSSSLILLLPSLPSFLLECRRRGAAGRLQRRLGSGGAATMPGTAPGPGGCYPRGRPGLSRAPARTPQSPKSHWEVWVGKRKRRGGSEGVFAVASEADGGVKARRRPFLLWSGSCVAPGWIRWAPFPIWCCPKVGRCPVRIGHCPELASARSGVLSAVRS